MFRIFATDIDISPKNMVKIFIGNLIMCILVTITTLGIGGYVYTNSKNVLLDNARYIKEIEVLKENNSKLIKDNESLSIEIKSLTDKNNNNKETIDKLNRDITDITKSKADLEKKIKDIQKEKVVVKPKVETKKNTVMKPTITKPSSSISLKQISRYKYAYDLPSRKAKDRYVKHVMKPNHVEEMINVLSKKNAKFDPHVMLAIYAFESNLNHNLRSPSGSGYGQLIYSTGKWRYEKVLKKGTYKRDMALDPIINIQITADYFADIVKERKGDLYQALRRYNGNAIGDLYMKRISQTLVKYTGKDLDYYNSQSKQQYK